MREREGERALGGRELKIEVKGKIGIVNPCRNMIHEYMRRKVANTNVETQREYSNY